MGNLFFTVFRMCNMFGCRVYCGLSGVDFHPYNGSDNCTGVCPVIGLGLCCVALYEETVYMYT